MKNEVEKLNAVPSKRLFLSIIADYDLNKSICELVDNALDVWIRNEKVGTVNINVDLDAAQQTISVEDDAGGLKKSELKYIVGPGHTGTDSADQTIGIFGVGTKRAVVALAMDIKVRTRYPKEKTYQIDFDDKWLGNEDWELPVYEVDPIPQGRTIVELQRLRYQITEEVIISLREHLEVTYAKFLTDRRVVLKLNGVAITPKFFENWAYPPGYVPRRYTGTITVEGNKVEVSAVGGLISESSPAAGEYGVYFYCNDRLVARALKTFEVGFMKGFAGQPHPKVSLTRVIVSLKGDAKFMPWNSSKSDIATKHEVFLSLHDWLVQVVKDYATLSRIWVGEWPEKVFKYKTGSIEEVRVENFPGIKKSYLPPLPKSRPRYGEVVSEKNKVIADKKPWVRGLYEGVIAAEVVSKQNLEQKNRIALIVLDSTLEIAFKEYLVNESGAFYTDAQISSIFAARHLVEKEIAKYVKLTTVQKGKIKYYYGLRSKLTHERASVTISDRQIEDYRAVVEAILKKLYKLDFNIQDE